MIEERIERLKQLMESSGSEGLVLFPGVDLFYATGLRTHASERLIAAIIPREGDPVLICPSFEKTRMEKSFTYGSIRIWEEIENPFRLFGNTIKELNLESKQLALDNKLWFEWFLKIRKQLPDSNFVDASDVILQSRLTKSEEEIQIMRRASAIAANSIINTFKQVTPGMTELEIVNIVNKDLSKKANPAFALVQSGPNSALPHGNPSERKIEKDDILLIDAGPILDGYFGDITITSVIGKPSAKFEEIYNIVYNANRAAFNLAKEGAIAEQLDIAARELIEKKGFGKYFTHRLGHGIGVEGHERPYIVKGNNLVLKEGMCHTIEPGIYLEGEFGVRIEDDVVIRKGNCELLFDTPRRIWETI